MRLLAAGLLSLLVWAAAASAQAPDPTDPGDAAPPIGEPEEQELDGIPYVVSYEGDLNEDLRDLLRQVSELERQAEERLPATPAALRRRVQDERGRFEAALRSAGYYDFEIDTQIDSSVQPARVGLIVEPGPQFTLGGYEIVYRPAAPDAPGNDLVIPRAAEDLDLEIGMPAQAAAMQSAEERIVTRLNRAGYPYATVEKTEYVADHAAAELRARVIVAPGPRASFGALTIGGLEAVDDEYVRRVAKWPEGQLWDRRQMEEVRRRLADTQLFSTVVLDYAEEVPTAAGPVPVELILREREHRTIGLGASITSSEDYLRAEARWEHRNLFGSGERLELAALGSYLRQEARASFRKPNFYSLNQTLVARASLERETSDAFDEKTGATSIGIVRDLDEDWTVELDLAYEFSEQTDAFGTDRFSLVGLPSAVTYDTRDSVLDPTEGVSISTRLTPWTAIGERESNFVIGELIGSTYWSPFENDRLVFAARSRIGSLFFAESRDVPASKRFFAGGGGSVRGYDFRSIGPRDADGDPLGGRSVVELGLEARIRVTERIGVVPFVDAGQVYADTLPEPDFDWQWAAGLGFRYDLGIGPARVDFAVPINPRDRDGFFEFYLSIGQAF